MCLDLPPLGECAWGQCVNGQCVCDPGFIQNVELLFRPVASNETLICDYSVQGAIGSTIAILVLTAAVFVMQLTAIENRNQFRRQFPILIGYVLLLTALGIRLARPTDPLWGIDYVFTFCIVLHMTVYTLQIIIFLNRYNVYLERTLLTRRKTKRSLQMSYAASYINVVVVLVGSCLWLVPLFIEDLETSGMFTVAGCAMFAVATGLVTLANTYLLTRYINDISRLLGGPSDKLNTLSAEFSKKAGKQLPRVKSVRFFNVSGSFLFCFCLILTVVFEGMLKYLLFIVYGILVTYQVGNFCILRTFSKRYRAMWTSASNKYSKAFPSFRGSKSTSNGNLSPKMTLGNMRKISLTLGTIDDSAL